MAYLGLDNPYQAMFFYDRELMEEHAGSATFDVFRYGAIEQISANPDHPGGGVAERAAYGMTFVDVPPGFRSRNVVPYLSNLLLIDSNCFVRHLPNNYADNPKSSFAKLPVRQLIRP